MISLFYMVKAEGKSVAEHYFTDLQSARDAAKQFAAKSVGVNYVILAPIEATRATVPVFEDVQVEVAKPVVEPAPPPDIKPDPVPVDPIVVAGAVDGA